MKPDPDNGDALNTDGECDDSIDVGDDDIDEDSRDDDDDVDDDDIDDDNGDGGDDDLFLPQMHERPRTPE